MCRDPEEEILAELDLQDNDRLRWMLDRYQKALEDDQHIIEQVYPQARNVPATKCKPFVRAQALLEEAL